MASTLIKISILFIVAFSSYAHAQVNYVPGEIIIKLKNESTNDGSTKTGSGTVSSKQAERQSRFMGKAQSQKGLVLKSQFTSMDVFHFALKPGQNVQEAIADIQADPDVEYAEPNYIFNKATVGGFSQKFSKDEIQQLSGGGYLATGAPIEVVDTWGSVTYNSDPVVAVIDTGLDLTHSVFQDSNAIWTNIDEIANNGIDDDNNGYVDDIHGWNFVNNSKNIIDDDDHGTHVAGIILGVSLNIYNTPYPSSHVKIMALKFLDGSGYGKTSDAIRAIYYAVNNGAKVLNNSWGGPSYSAALHEAIAYSYQKGVVFVAAAGNDNKNNDVSPMYPANYNVPNVIAVAATTDNDYLAYFSNFGKNSVELASPGVGIYSTVPGDSFSTSSGTSMAAPFVSGVAALIKAEKPTMLAYQIKQIIVGNADVVTDLSNKVESNARLNANSVVTAAKTASVDATQPSYSFTNEDRQLASAIAGGGCGMVQKLMGNGGGSGTPNNGASPMMVFFIIGLLVVPILIYSRMRNKENAKNRRQHDRYKIDSEVRVKVGGRELIGQVSSISMGGVQINTEAMLEQGGIVQMSIRSPDGKEQVQVEGRVVWSEAQKAYGVQFAQTAEPVRQTILAWTRNLVKN
jgi:subtilisin family serine protease